MLSNLVETSSVETSRVETSRVETSIEATKQFLLETYLVSHLSSLSFLQPQKISSVYFSHSVLSDSLQPHGL